MALINKLHKMPGEQVTHIQTKLPQDFIKELTQLMLTLTQQDLVI
jgi:hypothetical protein